MSAPAYLPDHGSGRVISILGAEAMSLRPEEARVARDNYRRCAERTADADGFYAGLVRDLDNALGALASARPSPTHTAVGAAS